MLIMILCIYLGISLFLLENDTEPSCRLFHPSLDCLFSSVFTFFCHCTLAAYIFFLRLVNFLKSFTRKNRIAGAMIKISGFAFMAPEKLNCISLVKAVVSPHPGHSNSNTVFHKQGMQISIPETDLIPADSKR